MNKFICLILPILILLFACQSKQGPVKTDNASDEGKKPETSLVEGDQSPEDPGLKDVKPPGKDTKNASTLFKRGLELIQAQNYEEGIGYLDRALETDPKNARIFFNRGYAYYSMKKYDQALADSCSH
jgi:tetratricopeptide (TPR) repeat protein